MKKVISLVLAIVIIFSLSIPVQAISAPSFDITSDVETLIPTQNDQYKLSWLDKFKIAKWIVRLAGQALIKESEGSTSYGSDWCEKHSGFHKFGDAANEVLALEQFAYLEEQNSGMLAFVYTSFGSWTKTLTLIAEYPNNGGYVYDGNGLWGGHVEHNQIKSFFPSATDPRGAYQVHFIDDKENTKFDCYLRCWVYTPDTRGTSGMNLPPEDSFKLNGADVQYIPDLNKQFIKPSNQWLSTRTYTLNSNKPLNATQLSNQFYDTTYGLFVNDLRDYSVGDQIVFSDQIAAINYSEEENMTELIFACDAGDIFWQFNGDLRSRYAVGDTVKLVLTVEAEAVSGDMVFENLDYILLTIILCAPMELTQTSMII